MTLARLAALAVVLYCLLTGLGAVAAAAALAPRHPWAAALVAALGAVSLLCAWANRRL